MADSKEAGAEAPPAGAAARGGLSLLSQGESEEPSAQVSPPLGRDLQGSRGWLWVGSAREGCHGARRLVEPSPRLPDGPPEERKSVCLWTGTQVFTMQVIPTSPLRRQSPCASGQVLRYLPCKSSYGPPKETKSVCLSTHIFTMQVMRVKSDPGFPAHASPQVSLTRSLLSMSAGRNQFSSAAQSCPTLCDPMDCSRPGLPVHHQLPEFAQTHVHRVSDAIQPSHPLSSPSPPAPNPSQH